MKTSTIVGSLALALPAFAAPAPQPTVSSESGTCPSNNKAVLVSNNWISYKVHCSKDMSTEVIRVTDTENGMLSCLTACDGTANCEAVTFVADSSEQTTGKCYNRRRGKTHAAGDDTAVAFRVAGGATTTLTTWPSNIAPTATSVAAAATVTPKSVAETPKVFSGLSLRSASPIHFGAINANGTNFYIGRGTSTYCPGGVVDPCPSQNNTLFVGGDNTLSLDVVVPGGQQVYVDSAGALRYTVAHSASTGTNSSTTGFTADVNLQHNGNDWLACPIDDVAYVVFSANTVQARTDCLGFSFRIAEITNATAAWQYA